MLCINKIPSHSLSTGIALAEISRFNLAFCRTTWIAPTKDKTFETRDYMQNDSLAQPKAMRKIVAVETTVDFVRKLFLIGTRGCTPINRWWSRLSSRRSENLIIYRHAWDMSECVTTACSENKPRPRENATRPRFVADWDRDSKKSWLCSV